MAITGGNKDIKQIYCNTPNGVVEVTDVYAGTQCLWCMNTLKYVYLTYHDQSFKIINGFVNWYVSGKEGDYIEVVLGNAILRNTKDNYKFNLAYSIYQGEPICIIPLCNLSASSLKVGDTVTVRWVVNSSSSGTGSVSSIVERIELK